MASARLIPFGPEAVTEAAWLIRDGQPVAIPSETVYGLAADATSGEAVAAIYAAKGRPGFNPLIVHVADRAMADAFAFFSPLAERLVARFWPGPLTLVLPARPESPVAALATAGLPTVALRCPAHPAMQAVIAASGRPLAAPSANRSGSISPTTAAHVLSTLGERIALVIDGGATPKGLESTIVAIDGECLRLLRPGPVTVDALREACGVEVTGASGGAIEAPGQLASHYCPDKPVRIDVTDPRPDEYLIGFGAMACDTNLSPSGDVREAAASLFAALHAADAGDRPAIAVAPVPHHGLGAAINDRLARAAVRAEPPQSSQ